jgi:hypothetical protein
MRQARLGKPRSAFRRELRRRGRHAGGAASATQRRRHELKRRGADGAQLGGALTIGFQQVPQPTGVAALVVSASLFPPLWLYHGLYHPRVVSPTDASPKS